MADEAGHDDRLHLNDLAAASLTWPVLARGLVDRAPALLLLQASEVVLAQGEVPQLALELVVAGQALRREGARGGRGQDGAAGLFLVPAIREPAGQGQRLHVRERALQGIGRRPELQLAQARRVHEERSA